jgi:hypothetical protein
MHVLIDLVGYTGGGERANEIFASRPAALQATILAAFYGTHLLLVPSCNGKSSLVFCYSMSVHESVSLQQGISFPTQLYS